ncbi:hypothetical protein EVAR_82317_1 [Eumeta japonica]|uniref:Uncharacterized protein n=1 Tax=Eumeta variegata TaxID=151549 RepID=A0A4C1U9R9_EUMVA|nr:hypothetical protein EVAR_82317_1 [Eumeta japonica]
MQKELIFSKWPGLSAHEPGVGNAGCTQNHSGAVMASIVLFEHAPPFCLRFHQISHKLPALISGRALSSLEIRSRSTVNTCKVLKGFVTRLLRTKVVFVRNT